MSLPLAVAIHNGIAGPPTRRRPAVGSLCRTGSGRSPNSRLPYQTALQILGADRSVGVFLIGPGLPLAPVKAFGLAAFRW